MEKEIWKWILDHFLDEGIAAIAHTLGIKIPGFRQLNPQQQKFKIVRPKIIQAALHQRHAQDLNEFFRETIEEGFDIESFKEKGIEELMQLVEEEMSPSILLSVLLSSEDEENQAKAEELYTRLKEEDKLELLEKQANETETDDEDVQDNEGLRKLHEELKSAQQLIDKLEKRLKKFEQKNEELKSKEAMAQNALKNEKKRGKDEKKVLSNEVNALKGEIGNLKHQVNSATSEKESLQKTIDKQIGSIKTKDEEIARLNALVLKLNTDLDRLSELEEVYGGAFSDQQKIKVALIGNPKNSSIQKYPKFELTIIEGPDVEEEMPLSLDQLDQIWLLTYKVPRSIQKCVRSLGKGKQMKEFATFTDLENYMLKGMI